MNEHILNVIRSSLEDIEHKRCILFGSQARGDALPDSDFDLLIVVPHSLTAEQRLAISRTIRSRLAEHLIPVDVLVRTSREAGIEKHLTGAVVRHALAEGVAL